MLMITKILFASSCYLANVACNNWLEKSWSNYIVRLLHAISMLLSNNLCKKKYSNDYCHSHCAMVLLSTIALCCCFFSVL